MNNLIVLLFFVSLISLIVGLIHPKFFEKIFRGRKLGRKFVLKIFGTATVVLFVIIGIIAGPADKIIDKTGRLSSDQATNSTEGDSQSQSLADSNSAEQTISNESDIPDLYSVTQIVDGDTIKIDINGEIKTLRLIGIDTPETVDPRKSVQCFGKEASNKATELLGGKKVRIEKDSTQGDFDKYGRQLAYVYREDGLFYNKYMIEKGYAHEYTYSTPYKYQTEFRAAQKSAQDNKIGLWSSDTCEGDTTTPVVSPTPNVQVADNSSPAEESTGKYYTSSYGTSKYYYPESCDGWKSLSTRYLKTFDSLGALLKAYPSRTLSPSCD